MIKDIVVEMMPADFLLWRCLHGGPLTRENLPCPRPHPQVPWAEFRLRNLPFLHKLTTVYGACAVIARQGDNVVGHLRFYPKAVRELQKEGGLCLQQKHPAGPADNLVLADFQPLEKLTDKTLVVHCLLVAATAEKSYQRQGIGSRMARKLVEWARDGGWRAIEAQAYEDLGGVYAGTGLTGKIFWEKQGFRVVETGIEPAFLKDTNGLVNNLRRQAAARGLDPECVRNKYTLRLEMS